jgi:hypothetical protein
MMQLITSQFFLSLAKYGTFREAIQNDEYCFHLTVVPPEKMLVLDSDDFCAQEMPGTALGNVMENLMNELDGKQVLLPDSYVRKKHPYDVSPIPHIKNPHLENVWRTPTHTDVFLCSDLVVAMNKFRTAKDRMNWYGNGKEYGHQCYAYLFRPSDVRRSEVNEMQITELELFGKSPYPVKYVACYKIVWNGHGYDNINIEYVQLNN